jgi:hypothetical protein
MSSGKRTENTRVQQGSVSLNMKQPRKRRDFSLFLLRRCSKCQWLMNCAYAVEGVLRILGNMGLTPYPFSLKTARRYFEKISKSDTTHPKVEGFKN